MPFTLKYVGSVREVERFKFGVGLLVSAETDEDIGPTQQ